MHSCEKRTPQAVTGCARCGVKPKWTSPTLGFTRLAPIWLGLPLVVHFVCLSMLPNRVRTWKKPKHPSAGSAPKSKRTLLPNGGAHRRLLLDPQTPGVCGVTVQHARGTADRSVRRHATWSSQGRRGARLRSQYWDLRCRSPRRWSIAGRSSRTVAERPGVPPPGT